MSVTDSTSPVEYVHYVDWIDILATTDDGFPDDGFELCLRAMDRLYKFSPCIPDFVTIPYCVPPLSTHSSHNGRNLWIDAFGLINFISFWAYTEDPFWLVCAARLVNAVHETLGKTRDGTRYLDGATEHEPMKGGLRAGKVLEIGSVNDSADCQDFLAISMWVFGLNRLSFCSQNALYNRYALKLIAAVYPRFNQYADKEGRMPQKLTIDLKEIPGVTRVTRSYLITSLAAMAMQETRWTFGPTDMPLKSEIRGLITLLTEVSRERPEVFHCRDGINTAGDRPRLFLDFHTLQTMALSVLIGHHSDGYAWGPVIARSGRGAFERFLKKRVDTLNTELRDDQDLYSPSAPMELFLMAVAQSRLPQHRARLSSNDLVDYDDVDNVNKVLFYWHARLNMLLRGASEANGDLTEMCVMYVAANMPMTLEVSVSLKDEIEIDALME